MRWNAPRVMHVVLSHAGTPVGFVWCLGRLQVAEQLSVYQQNLKEKARHMQAMASELNMYQAQVNEYKFEIERLSRELQDVKRKYYEVCGGPCVCATM